MNNVVYTTTAELRKLVSTNKKEAMIILGEDLYASCLELEYDYPNNSVHITVAETTSRRRMAAMYRIVLFFNFINMASAYKVSVIGVESAGIVLNSHISTLTTSTPDNPRMFELSAVDNRVGCVVLKDIIANFIQYYRHYIRVGESLQPEYLTMWQCIFNESVLSSCVGPEDSGLSAAIEGVGKLLSFDVWSAIAEVGDNIDF